MGCSFSTLEYLSLVFYMIKWLLIVLFISLGAIKQFLCMLDSSSATLSQQWGTKTEDVLCDFPYFDLPFLLCKNTELNTTLTFNWADCTLWSTLWYEKLQKALSALRLTFICYVIHSYSYNLQKMCKLSPQAELEHWVHRWEDIKY